VAQAWSRVTCWMQQQDECRPERDLVADKMRRAAAAQWVRRRVYASLHVAIAGVAAVAEVAAPVVLSKVHRETRPGLLTARHTAGCHMRGDT
jgi:hypothetical protein